MPYIHVRRLDPLKKSEEAKRTWTNGMPTSAAKCAVRALADVLRTELIRYSGPASKYSVHIAFPSNFISPSFIDEQKNKPELTKRLEGTTGPLSELSKKLHSSKQVADYIVAAVDKKQYIICSEYEAALLFGAMIGPSPKKGPRHYGLTGFHARGGCWAHPSALGRCQMCWGFRGCWKVNSISSIKTTALDRFKFYCHSFALDCKLGRGRQYNFCLRTPYLSSVNTTDCGCRMMSLKIIS